ncbi:ankyrin repeat domain-containing protein 53-like [Physella acuta]|uniref:ankyrin repeat domain-containing protein 53-like n=1 Tax=Physella acuta TaxID=109671 RepID=UPI0027DD43E5|nr:ankyrin repeat domain-containing protein 53-like [Physella acuta]XP_059145688.1 ankyrin repeat domain-containing protein 53-like [Physella acuta]
MPLSHSKTRTSSSLSDFTQGMSLRRRRTKITTEKKIADDEFMAAAIGDPEWLKQSLKDAGPELNFDKNGLTALHLSAIHGRLECLKLCIEKFKIDVNLPSKTGWRPVHLCISNQTGKRSLQCLLYLLENGADPSITNDDGVTPVHQAASEGHVQCLKILLELGAKIDGKDCRGNTPLDLAKLWGHRKCARILAAEMWHHDKEFVAKEMLQLKKMKMQQVLKDFEEEEKIKSEHLYEHQTFHHLSNSGNQPEKASEPGNGQTEKKSFGMHKPNSVARSGDTKTLHTPALHTPKQKADPLDERFEDFSKKDVHLIRECDVKYHDTKDETSKKNSQAAKFYIPDEWNVSTKPEENPYQPGLADHFPRDEYTLMPKVKGAPKYFEGKFLTVLNANNVDEDVKRKGVSAKLRKPKLPADVIKSVMSREEGGVARGMIFKCQHIHDVHTKRKFDAGTKGLPETPFHLTNDIRSFLLQNSLHVLQCQPKTSSSKSESTASLPTTEWTQANFPRPLVLQTLKNMSRPNHFPNIKGEERLFIN